MNDGCIIMKNHGNVDLNGMIISIRLLLLGSRCLEGACMEMSTCPGDREKPSKNIVELFGLKAWEVSTLPETNISPENGCALVKGDSYEKPSFSGGYVSFREGNIPG